MRSSGLIYAVIVGAWAAYLVPMWLRRQDELNEARPTERFSTAIRLLSGRAAMQRRYDKEHGEYPADDAGEEQHPDALADEAAAGPFADPADEPEALHTRVQPAPPRPSLSERAKRAKVLARRRRTITVLFLAFTVGAVVAAVGGLPFLWAPALPALLLTAYIVYLRAQERRRFTFTMDQRKAEAAAQRLREDRRRPRQAAEQPPADDHPADARAEAPADAAPEPPRAAPPAHTAGRRAVVEETDHAEWVDQQRERERPTPAAGSWEPVPVPLPTYVTAPVAPRATSHVDLEADDAWSSARSSAASDHPRPDTPARRPRGRTPLFDQYENEDRPRAANE
ncbi:divisome protein SepX/GlpR [Streptomyces sp. NPDC002446]